MDRTPAGRPALVSRTLAAALSLVLVGMAAAKPIAPDEADIIRLLFGARISLGLAFVSALGARQSAPTGCRAAALPS